VLRIFFKEGGNVFDCGRMVTEIVPVEIPVEILQLAERSGISREKMSALLRDFAVLDVMASSSKLTRKEAERLSREIKVSAWKRLSPYTH
jgi:hypothetical protein